MNFLILSEDVTSGGDDRVYVYDMEGTLVDTIGTDGTGPGDVYAPVGVAVDDDQNVYVTSGIGETVRVEKFDSDHNFLTSWGSFGYGDSKFDNHWGIDAGPGNFIAIADLDNDYIQVFDSDGNLIVRWGTNGTGDGEFNEPADVAYDSNGNIYVADSNNSRIQKFDGSGAFITSFGTDGTGDGQFESPMSIGLDLDNNIYVGDWVRTDVQKFDSDGNFLTKFGSFGSGPGQFFQPLGIFIDDENYIFVNDALNMNVQRFGNSSVVDNVPTECETVLATDGSSDVSSISQRGSKKVRVSNSNKPLANVNMNFHRNRDWNDVRCGVDYSGGKSFLYLDGTNVGKDGTFTLFVPTNGKRSVIVCPGAASLGDVSPTCVNGRIFSGTFPQSRQMGNDNVTVSLVDISAEEFWEISGISGTGGMSLDSSSNTFHPPTKCYEKKPTDTTWVNFEYKDDGLYLTWTQYDANEVTIEIDDGSGTFPWRVYKTLNDGHEFLKNVTPWQSLRLKPYNHCKSGDYSPSISGFLFPRGWFSE